jgi:hypothetical protein
MRDNGFTLAQPEWVKPGRKKSKRRARRQARMSASKTLEDIRFPEVYSCPLKLTIPGLDASYEPGKGWVNELH